MRQAEVDLSEMTFSVSEVLLSYFRIRPSNIYIIKVKLKEKPGKS